MTYHRQAGVSLVSAIFLLVVLAGLAVFAVRMTSLQSQSVSARLRSAQALHAARSGIAWAAHRAVNAGWCATQTLNFSEGGTAGFSVAIDCSQSSHSEGGSTVNVFVITALAQAGVYGGPDYVSRNLLAKVADES